MIYRIWADESGYVISTELMMVATILVLGMIVGLVSIRDQVIQELADTGAAILRFNQSYSMTRITGHSTSTAGANFADLLDFCNAVFLDNPPGEPALCISVSLPPDQEG